MRLKERQHLLFKIFFSTSSSAIVGRCEKKLSSLFSGKATTREQVGDRGLLLLLLLLLILLSDTPPMWHTLTHRVVVIKSSDKKKKKRRKRRSLLALQFFPKGLHRKKKKKNPPSLFACISALYLPACFLIFLGASVCSCQGKGATL